MYLFEGKSEKEIHFKCKLCLLELKFVITSDEFKKAKEFPLIKEAVHGTPPHKLIVYLNKNLEVETFSIEDILQKEVSYSKELTYQVLSDIQLTEEEIKLYFLTTGRDAVSLAEMAFLIDKSKEECKQIAEKFVEKGLYKEIVGATPHYAPLPPYAALIKQLSNFNEYIKGIQHDAPIQLNQSFSQLESKTKGINELNEYTTFIKQLKNNIENQITTQKGEIDKSLAVIGQIRKINEVIYNLENDTKLMIDEEIIDIGKQFEEIKKLIADNLQRLHLGVIRKTVDQIIENVLTSRLQVIVDEFNAKFITKIRNIITDIVSGINEITASSIKTGEKLENTFAGIIDQFSKSVGVAENKVKGISDDILTSFADLRNTFSTKVVDTLNQELAKINDRLEVSQITTREFWDQAKKKSLMSMKDLWFIRSLEGAKAHIDEEISKVKMRVLIVAPYLTDINVSLLESLPKHVNIRIATYIDMNSSEHVLMLQRLSALQNVSYRHRSQTNLFGINRDFEEVILCIFSKVEMAQRAAIEIGGIGSIIQEHIKIFVPVLEEAWVGAQKISGVPTVSSVSQRPIPAPTPMTTMNEESQRPMTRSSQYIRSEETRSTNDLKTLLNQPQPKMPTKMAEDLRPTQVEIPAKTTNPSSFNQTGSNQPIKAQNLGANVSQNMSVIEQFDYIISKIDGTNGLQLSMDLRNLMNRIIDKVGYSSQLNPINITISSLSQNPGLLNSIEKEELIKKINFWKTKLNL